MSTQGGKREGAGRKKGSYTRPQLRDYISETEIRRLVEIAKTQASEKPEILKFVLEHIFGKAIQAIDMTSKGQSINPTEQTRAMVERAVDEALNAKAKES